MLVSDFNILKNSKLTGIYAVNLIFLSFIFRTAIPILKYPAIVIYAVVLIYAFAYFRFQLRTALYSYLKNFYLPLINLALVILWFLLSEKIYLVVFKDIINTVIITSLFFILYLFIQDSDDIKSFYKNFLKQSFIFALVIAFFEIGSVFNIFSSEISYSEYFSENSSVNDYNFTLIPVFIGVIVLLFKLNTILNFKQKFLFNFLLFILSFSIVISGSRRGIALLILFFTLMILTNIILLFKQHQFLQKLAQNIRILFLMITVSAFICIIYLTSTSYESKISLLKKIGSKNTVLTINNISHNLYRYVNFFKKNISYSDFFNIMWNPSNDPDNPDSGWGVRIHKTVYPLTGINKEIVPSTAKGYLMDSTCNSHTWTGNAYSFTQFWRNEVGDGDSLEASAYCFVSGDFNGTNAYLYGEGALEGIRAAFYDMNSKGTWQKLCLNLNCKSGVAYVSLYFSQFGKRNFDSLRGHVIFAYPVAQVYEQSKKSTTQNLNYADSIRNLHHNLKITKEKNLQNANLVLPFIKIINWDSIYQKDTENDFIRSFTKKIISEDTIYPVPKTNLSVDSTDIFTDRFTRWRFAGNIFRNEYNLFEKIFGNGFSFLNWYGFYFVSDKKISDWPHNPFLSILLYSGLIGLFIYLLMLYRAIRLYMFYVYEFTHFFICFIIVFFFSFFSGSSPFDPPLMGFFIILPFFINCVEKKVINDKNPYNW